MPPLLLCDKLRHMPELPEVEHVVRALRRVVVGRRIVAAEVTLPKLILPTSTSAFRRKLKGSIITGVDFLSRQRPASRLQRSAEVRRDEAGGEVAVEQDERDRRTRTRTLLRRFQCQLLERHARSVASHLEDSVAGSNKSVGTRQHLRRRSAVSRRH